ncbi:HepT-like ribonuclease domain-containing protein [Lunatibacter salilacus]|uniref:HepT-like ribonuclease domain-containing protein n=1 Tax=Lunatibacter salilacus TaxID=2483804 RepID=UPI00131EC5FC|nr:HepT-like ribonuclease domain-containing protein [Lunatibacter salilacus]
MQPKVLKYILDIQSVIQEIETVKSKTKNNFISFESDIILQRAIERDLEIIGEAVRKIIEIDPAIKITSAKNIIGLRNIISHAYDTVEPEMIWGIIQNNIPVLADEIKNIKGT